METNATRGDSGGPGRIFRLAKEADAGRLRDIYRPYVTDTAVTFEYDVPSVAEFASRIRHISAQYPYLVCEERGEIAGYAYLSPFRERAAYDWDVETSVYIEERFQNRGIGSGFYARLLAFAEELGYYNAYGVVTLPNAGSLALHKLLALKMPGSGTGVDTSWAGGMMSSAWKDIWAILIGNRCLRSVLRPFPQRDYRRF